MQPTYLPWPGYFNLICKSDKFIFLDCVKFEKSSWHVRNKFLINSKESFITVPVIGSRNQKIYEVSVNDSLKWRSKHIKTLEQTYGKHPYGKQILDIIVPIIADTNLNHLSKLNIQLIKQITIFLNIRSSFELSTDLEISGKRSEKLINLCQLFNDRQYLSPTGSKEYIQEDGLFAKNNILVEYQNFISKEYLQFKNETFIPYLSIIDLIANIGPKESYKYIKGWGI